MNHHRFYGDETERRKWQNPEAILVDIGLRPGFTFVDVGCGEGFFAIPAAKIVGSRGRVYALDLDEDAVKELRETAAREGLRNLRTAVGAAEDAIFCETCADIVFFGIVLHDFSVPSKVLANAKKMLKPTGRLIDLDWKKQPTGFGPPLRMRLSEEEASALIEEAGFVVERTEEAGPHHYVVTATRRA